MLKKWISVFLALLILVTPGCSILQLPFKLVESLFKMGKQLIPYALFFVDSGERGERGCERDFLAAILQRESERQWEALPELEDVLRQIRPSKGKIVAVAIPLVNGRSEQPFSNMLEEVEGILHARGLDIRDFPRYWQESFCRKGAPSEGGVGIADGFDLNLEPLKLRELEETLSAEGVELVFLPVFRKEASG